MPILMEEPARYIAEMAAGKVIRYGAILKVCGLGEVLWDAFPDGEKFGGAPANFVCHCNSLGARAYSEEQAPGSDKQRGKQVGGVCLHSTWRSA